MSRAAPSLGFGEGKWRLQSAGNAGRLAPRFKGEMRLYTKTTMKGKMESPGSPSSSPSFGGSAMIGRGGSLVLGGLRVWPIGYPPVVPTILPGARPPTDMLPPGVAKGCRETGYGELLLVYWRTQHPPRAVLSSGRRPFPTPWVLALRVVECGTWKPSWMAPGGGDAPMYRCTRYHMRRLPPMQRDRQPCQKLGIYLWCR
jgi:hypothetical protein